MNKNTKKEILSWVGTFAIAIAVALVLKSKVIILANIPSESMCNTIKEKNQVFGSRLAYNFEDPERGDVVIFDAPDKPGTLYIKRVIGLPGEHVVIDDAKIYIDGSDVPLKEDYINADEEWNRGTGYFEFDVPDDCYLMLGDNRNHSEDARYWVNTYVHREAIVAKANFVYFPFSAIHSLDEYKY